MTTNIATSRNSELFFFHCHKCKQKLCCLRNSSIIECANCNEICMPYSEYIMICIGCNKKLHYPPSAQIIQCSHSECGQIMNVCQNPITECKVNTNGKIIECKRNDKETKSIVPYRTAFELFVNGKKKNNNQLKLQQLKSEWDSLKTKERAFYMKMSLNDRKQYFKQLQLLNNNNENEFNDIDHGNDEQDIEQYDNKNNVNNISNMNQRKREKEKIHLSKKSAFNFECNKNVNEWNVDNIMKWLQQIGMLKYVETLKAQFIEDGIIGSDLKYVSMLDLQDYGVRDANHRRWILQNIRILNQPQQ